MIHVQGQRWISRLGAIKLEDDEERIKMDSRVKPENDEEQKHGRHSGPRNRFRSPREKISHSGLACRGVASAKTGSGIHAFSGRTKMDFTPWRDENQFSIQLEIVAQQHPSVPASGVDIPSQERHIRCGVPELEPQVEASGQRPIDPSVDPEAEAQVIVAFGSSEA
jgi:hypothetical protein